MNRRCDKVTLRNNVSTKIVYRSKQEERFGNIKNTLIPSKSIVVKATKSDMISQHTTPTVEANISDGSISTFDDLSMNVTKYKDDFERIEKLLLSFEFELSDLEPPEPPESPETDYPDECPDIFIDAPTSDNETWDSKNFLEECDDLPAVNLSFLTDL